MEEKEVKRTSNLAIILVVGLSSVFVLGCIGLFIFGILEIDTGEYTDFDYAITGEAVINNKVEIADVVNSINPTNNRYYVTGYLHNISNKNFEFVTVEYSFYDNNGVLLDRVSATISNLEKHEKWKFYLEYSGNSKEVGSYKVTKVSFY